MWKMQFIGEIVITAVLRAASIRQLAGPEGTHAPSWWCLLCRCTEKQNGSNGFSLQKDTEHALCKLDDIKLRSHEVSLF